MPDIVQALDSRAQDAYRIDELTVLGVSLGSFDPKDKEFLESEAYTFAPLCAGMLKKYFLVESEVGGGALE